MARYFDRAADSAADIDWEAGAGAGAAGRL
eukprot:COSAG03_NODE_6865_length_993_cov_504.116331_2_plen_29_part_01